MRNSELRHLSVVNTINVNQIHGGKLMTRTPMGAFFNLEGKAALVTGGAKGIGQAIASRLAEAGARVMVSDIDVESARQTVEAIRQAGGQAEALQANAALAAEAQRSVQATVDAFGSVDILVNNAGIYPMSPFLETSEEVLERSLDTNLKGVFLHCQAAARWMVKAGRGGKIINVSSVASLRPLAQFAHYDASKGGVSALTRTLALELAPYRIRVNGLVPGGIRTPGVDGVGEAVMSLTGLHMDEYLKLVTAKVPLGRLGEPDEVARAALFLASEAASYVTGSMLLVDGGYLLS
jgi:NAD(P)-dependent dehydrogenase (short-subunit alcohol dehydrogenase family)